MKSSFILKNIGTAKNAEILLLVSYFFIDGEQEVVKSQNFHLALPNASELKQEIDFGETVVQEKEIIVLVKREEGNIITQKSFSIQELENQSVTIEFINNEELELEPSDEPLLPLKPNFVYGRLLDKKGIHKMEDIQIIISTKKNEDSDFEAISTVKTESNGYFVIDYPEGNYVEAVAQIGLNLTTNPVLIRLEKEIIGDDQDPISKFPSRILLVVDLVEDDAEQKEKDCSCVTLDFDQKRVLEEISFYSLVRTSEPAIKGYVLEDEDEITLDEVLMNLPLTVFELIEPLKTVPFIARESPIKFLPTRIGTVSTGDVRAAANDDEFLTKIKNLKVKKSVLNNFIKEEKEITGSNVKKLLGRNEIANFQQILNKRAAKSQALGRVVLDENNLVDWDDEPTLYQAVEVAHGHLLQFKSEWVADGYSLGDLLYSLPLAPGQKKQIVVFDWERRESASNIQSIDFEESLYNSLTRDRDILEIAKGTVYERVRGSSKASTGGGGGGIGGVISGIIFGIAGGYGTSSSRASQDSLRRVSSSDQQKLKDKLVQSANAVRSLRSTVIQTVSQGERFEVSSESVANYNHCHAITIQYFEVLRHFKIRQRFAGARECLFVPLLMSQFDLKKALRWKEALQKSLIDNKLLAAFDAGDRVLHEWENSDFPSGTFASENILFASGVINVKIVLQRPIDDFEEVDDKERPIVVQGVVTGYHQKKVAVFVSENWEKLRPAMGSLTPEEFYENYLANASNKDEVFHRMLGEKIVRAFVGSLKFNVANDAGNDIGTIPIDASLSSRYRRDGQHRITLRLPQPTGFARDKFHYLRITTDSPLSDESSVIVQSGFLRYKTKHFDGFLFRYQYLGDDLTESDGVTIYSGPTNEELRDPRKEDVFLVNRLVAHLNDNLEHYHKAIWMDMTPERRFMLLDGIILNGKGEGRSVASLVENELIAVVGNSLVFPVAPGLNLNPDFGLNESLTDFYAVTSPEPISVSVPTKGVFAEAVMGNCNSCEEKDESRFWRWEEAPIPDSPTAINPINTDTRRAEPGNLQPQQFPNPILSIQNAQSAPDPTGLGGVLGLLGKSDLFKDITGLEQNQKNALAAFQKSLDTATSFGKMGADLEIQKTMERRLDNALNKINNSNLEDDKKAELTERAINAYLGGGATKEEDKKNPDNAKFEEAIKMVDEMEKKGQISSEAAKELKENLKNNFLNSSSSEKPKSTTDETKLMEAAKTNKVSFVSEKPSGEKLEIRPTDDFSGTVVLETFLPIESPKNEGYFQKIKFTIEDVGGVRHFYLTNNTYDYIGIEVKGVKDENKVNFSNKDAFKNKIHLNPGPNNKKLLYSGKPHSGSPFSVLDPTGFEITRGNPAATHKANTYYALPFTTGKKFKCVGAFGDGLHVGDEKYSVDLLMPQNENILTAREGVIVDIIRVVNENPKDPNNPNLWLRVGGDGNLVTIRHDDDTYGVYAHLEKNSIPAGLNVGSQVTTGQIIGKVGITGNTNGPHLHFTVQDGGFQSIPWKFVNNSNVDYEPKINECYEAQIGKVTC